MDRYKETQDILNKFCLPTCISNYDVQSFWVKIISLEQDLKRTEGITVTLNQGKMEEGTASQISSLHRKMIQFWDWTNIAEDKEKGVNTSSTDSGVCKNMKKYLGSIQHNCPEASPTYPTSGWWELECISGQTPKAFYSLLWAQSCNSFLQRILRNSWLWILRSTVERAIILAGWMCAGKERWNWNGSMQRCHTDEMEIIWSIFALMQLCLSVPKILHLLHSITERRPQLSHWEKNS